jgi:Tfp pilus assembly PilM family ATPase
MSRILSIDWDRHEVRALLLEADATGASVEGAWAVPLDATATNQSPGALLAAAMAGHPLGKLTTIVGVGREQVQLKLLQLPPAPPEELPDLVRFQAERDFTSLGDDAAVDYVPLEGDAETPHRVLAAALRPAGMKEVEEICGPLGLMSDRVALRAFAAASLVRRATGAGHGNVALVANPLAAEADLAVLAEGQVVLVRSVRLPEESDARRQALTSEIRRTLAAASQQLGDSQVDEFWLCGNAASSDQSGSLSEDLGIPVKMFDPAPAAPAGLTRTGAGERALGRFAAVLGMALDEADDQPPAVDFKNVRRQIAPRRFARVHVLAAVAAAVVALAALLHFWNQSAAPLRELAQVEAEIERLQPMVEEYAQVTAEAEAMERWLATDVNWLDELERLGRKLRPEPFSSPEFPVDGDVVVKQLTFAVPPGNEAEGGLVDMDAVAKSASAIATLEQRLRDDRHRVNAGGGKQDKSLPGYEWAFGMRIFVASPDGPTTEGAR